MNTVLEAPVPEVADELQVGDELDLQLREGESVQVVVVDSLGRDAGAILAIGRLLECLREGFRFIAKVTSVDGGAIRVEVRPSA